MELGLADATVLALEVLLIGGLYIHVMVHAGANLAMPRKSNASLKSQQKSEPLILGGSVILVTEPGGSDGLLILQTNDDLTSLMIDAESAETLRDELDKFLKGQCRAMVEVEPEAWTH